MRRRRRPPATPARASPGRRTRLAARPVLLLLALVPAFALPAFLPEVSAAQQAAAEAPPRRQTGRNWLALIAVSDYVNYPALRAPINDVTEIKKILLDRYQFDETHTLTLLNEAATLEGIYGLFKELSRRVEPEDSLLLYYAGHGRLDTLTNTGYWIPYDGGIEFGQNWLGDVAVQGFLLNVRARHVLVIADSCFSGNLLEGARGALEDAGGAMDRYRRAYLYRSRTVLTSGNLEPVSDSAYGNHSAFAFHLMRTLESNSQPYIDVEDIYHHVRRGVTGQQPLMGSLRKAGHETGGAYIFMTKTAPPIAARLPGPPAGGDLPADGGADPSRPPEEPPLAADSTKEILEILRRWEERYEALDYDGLREIWPTCPWKKVPGVERYEITIPPESIEIRKSGVGATVLCRVRIKGFGRGTGENEFRAQFRLERQLRGGWKILDYRVLPN